MHLVPSFFQSLNGFIDVPVVIRGFFFHLEIATFLLKLLMELNFVNDQREIWRVCIFPPMVSSRYACFHDRVIVYTSSDRDSIFWNFIVGKETKLLLLSLPLLPPSYLAINPNDTKRKRDRDRGTHSSRPVPQTSVRAFVANSSHAPASQI